MTSLALRFYDRAADRMPAGMRPSPFTDRSQWIGQGDLTFAMVNYFPSTPGHALVLPSDFAVYRFYDLAQDELAEHARFARVLREEFNRHFRPDGFNIGWNVEFCGGQSIAHAHMHIMPRYNSINAQHKIDPRGGIARMPFPQLPAFWTKRRRAGDEADFATYLLQDAPVVAENDLAFAVQLTRKTAITPGHTWIFTKADRADFFVMQEEEALAQLNLALTVMSMQAQKPCKPDGFNLGWDVGAAGGQVCNRSYLQLVPRYKGDMDSPRGGVVRIIPQDAWPMQTEYYDKKNVGKDVPIQDVVTFPFTLFKSPARDDRVDLKARLSLE